MGGEEQKETEEKLESKQCPGRMGISNEVLKDIWLNPFMDPVPSRWLDQMTSLVASFHLYESKCNVLHLGNKNQKCKNIGWEIPGLIEDGVRTSNTFKVPILGYVK